MKELCDCGKMAVWVYAPGFSSGVSPYFCEDCVPRGCECNHHYVHEVDLEYSDLPTEQDNPFMWIKEGAIWCHLDEQGREYPCCEYDYDEDGFDKEDLIEITKTNE